MKAKPQVAVLVDGKYYQLNGRRVWIVMPKSCHKKHSPFGACADCAL
ncbi:hypothetical protein pf16_03 [Pseudomonas phage pf16]|uniref:Uncharacterized protein n=1 Tax=Pseudomonas phage pf16 TaxID=1815630 RepID=A0A1S5R3N1_9CAUD|nr:hypothetical protein FDG98_gp002 [Pseudomonas phage pf16]AND74926.1 hypothetical protein pf16_03 [Pseudomonas phage pf16]